MVTKVRSSSRGRNPPLWLKDFVSLSIKDGVTYPMANYIKYDHLAPKYQAYLSRMSEVTEPNTYNEVVQNPRWVEAMKLEIEALQNNHTWDQVALPIGKRPIGCRWTYKVKYKANRDIERFKGVQ